MGFNEVQQKEEMANHGVRCTSFAAESGKRALVFGYAMKNMHFFLHDSLTVRKVVHQEEVPQLGMKLK